MPENLQPGEDASGDSAPDNGVEVDVDRVLSAMADPTRRLILELLGRGGALSASAMAATLPISRQAVVQHLAVLAQSGLVTSRKSGREVLFSVRPEAVAGTASWMNTLAETWADRLAGLKQVAERQPPDQTR